VHSCFLEDIPGKFKKTDFRNPSKLDFRLRHPEAKGILQDVSRIVKATNNFDIKSSAYSLCRMFQDDRKSPLTRIHSIQALEKIKDKCPEEIQPKIRAYLVGILCDRNPEIRIAAAKTLADFGENQWEKTVIGNENDLISGAGTGDSRIFKGLMRRLEHLYFTGEDKITFALKKFGSSVVVPLIKILNSQTRQKHNVSLIYAACNILTDFKAPGIFEALAHIIEEFPEARSPAGTVLANLCEPRSIPLIKKSILKNGLTNKWLRNYTQIDNIVMPLVKLETLSTPFLLEMLVHADPEIRNQAAIALEKIADPKTVTR
jgi:hypothetical protein